MRTRHWTALQLHIRQPTEPLVNSPITRSTATKQQNGALALTLQGKYKAKSWSKLSMAPLLPSQGHALTLDLRNPRLDALLRHVVLVVLIQREPQELVALRALGCLVLVCAGIHVAHHLRTRGRKGLVQLLDAVAKVVAIALRVAAAEDGHGLASKVDALDVVQQVVPRCAGAVLVGVRVPRRAAHDQAVVAGKILRAVLTHIRSLDACLLRDDARHRLRVAGLRGVEQADGLAGRAAAASGCSIHGLSQASGAPERRAGRTPGKADLLRAMG